MNVSRDKFSLSAVACAIAFSVLSNATSAIEISSTTDAETLAETLIIPNSGVTITSFSLLGAGDVLETSQAGIFTNTSNVYGLPQAGGVVFSTGSVLDYVDGPNTDSGNSTDFSVSATTAQNQILSGITEQSVHFDPVELNIEFDVDSDVEQISFIASFGSEEFSEFVGSTFIDGFGMFLNGENVAGALETGAEPGDAPLAININHPDFTAISGTELDGVIAPNGIPLIRFDVPVEPNSVGNTFKLILADAGDGIFDSTIFLSSFGNFDADGGDSEFTPVLPDPSNPTNEDGAFVIELPEVEAGETIWFDPEIATGYTYTATNGGLFASVTAPTLLTVNDPDGYTVTYINQSGETIVESLFANSTLNFSEEVAEFTITGIDPQLALDPTDFTEFVTGVSFSEGGTFGVLQAPITSFIPSEVSSPSTFAFFGLGLVGFAGLSMRRKKLSISN